MKITENYNGKELTLLLDGNFDEMSSPEIEEKIDEALTKDITTITFDMSNVHYISSVGIKVLIVAHKKAVKLGKKIHIGKMSGKVRDIIEVVGILPLFGPSKGIRG